MAGMKFQASRGWRIETEAEGITKATPKHGKIFFYLSEWYVEKWILLFYMQKERKLIFIQGCKSWADIFSNVKHHFRRFRLSPPCPKFLCFPVKGLDLINNSNMEFKKVFAIKEGNEIFDCNCNVWFGLTWTSLW